MDLDGTLTQHKTPLCPAHRELLTQLAARYQLLIVGAGQAMRIFQQLGGFPLNIIGNYGMQYGSYCHEAHTLKLKQDISVPCDRVKITAQADLLRQQFGFTEFAGESVEFHPSGCVTIPILGTAANARDKLCFDPDRAKRRSIYADVVKAFPDYHVFIGGSSSFDLAPKPYHKYYALAQYCREHSLSHSQVIYIGDDYGPGGNDEAVYQSDFPYLTIDNYRNFPQVVQPLLFR